MQLPVHITDVLTTEQIAGAHQEGVERELAARALRQTDRHARNGTADESMEANAQAAISECLVANIHHLEWTQRGVRTPDGDPCDVGGFVSVKWTPRANGRLIVQHDVPNDIVIALCVCPSPDMVYVGAIDAAAAKQPQWWRDDVRNPAYFVPQHALR